MKKSLHLLRIKFGDTHDIFNSINALLRILSSHSGCVSIVSNARKNYCQPYFPHGAVIGIAFNGFSKGTKNYCNMTKFTDESAVLYQFCQ